MRDDRIAKGLARVEAAQRRTQERLDAQQERLNKRFERLRDKLAQEPGDPHDVRQRIIAAALVLLKQDGLSNISLRKLASMVDMQAPALYWYFKSKEDLVDYMAEAILEKEFKDLQPRRDDQTWQSWLTDHMLRLRRAMLAYPDGARVVAGAHLHPAVSLARSFETSLVSLSSAAIDLQIARRVIMTATTYTFGYVIEEQAAPTDAQLADFDMQEFLRPYPNMAKVVTDIIREQKSVDADFLAGLQYIINGSLLVA